MREEETKGSLVITEVTFLQFPTLPSLDRVLLPYKDWSQIAKLLGSNDPPLKKKIKSSCFPKLKKRGGG